VSDRAELDEVVRGLAAVEQDRSQGEQLLGELQNGSRQWGALSSAERRLASGVALLERVHARSREARFDDPAEMVRWAEIACTLARALSETRYGQRVVADIQARAWAELGNAYRVADDLERAGGAFGRAVALVEAGTGSSVVACRVLELAASYLAELRRFDDAVEILQAVEAKYREGGLAGETLRIMVNKGHTLSLANEPEDAMQVYGKALWCIGAEPDPLRLPIVHGLAYSMLEAGFPASAELLVQQNRREYRRAGRLSEHRLTWLEGKIAFALREFGKAEAKLNVARLAFSRIRKHYDAALVSLDLALLYLQLGRRRELLWLVDQMLRAFESLGVEREAIACVMLLRTSCEQQRPLELLRGQIETLAKLLPELQRRHKGKA
jgi:tetratricopeptide (TPR) repeat protein